MDPIMHARCDAHADQICKLDEDIQRKLYRLDRLKEEIEKIRITLINLIKPCTESEGSVKPLKPHSSLIDPIRLAENCDMEQYNAAMQLATFSVERARLLRDTLSQGAAMRKLKLELISMDEHKFYREDIYKNDEDWINTSEMKELWSEVEVFSTEKCALELAVQEEGNNNVAGVLKHGPKAQIKELDV